MFTKWKQKHNSGVLLGGYHDVKRKKEKWKIRQTLACDWTNSTRESLVQCVIKIGVISFENGFPAKIILQRFL